MGAGIVQVCARAGCEVVVREVNDTLLDSGVGHVRAGTGRWVSKGKIEEAEAEQIEARVQGTTDLAELFDADLVIEAIIEQEDEKREIFAALDWGCPGATILALVTRHRF